MLKQEFLKMMFQDNETEIEPNKTLYANVIGCMEIALNQMPDSFDVPGDKTVAEAYTLMESYAKELANPKMKALRGVVCETLTSDVVVEKIIAPYLGVTYERLKDKFKATPKKFNPDDFLD